MKEELQHYIVELVAEAFATCILIIFNDGAIANFKFANYTAYPPLIIYLAIGTGIYMGIFLSKFRAKCCFFLCVLALMTAGSITGAHINPAVSIPFMTIRKLKPLQCVFYVLGQFIGAFVGAAVVYFVFWSQINNFDGGRRLVSGANGTADIFFTMPDDGIPQWNTFLDQLVTTALLLIFIMSLEQV